VATKMVVCCTKFEEETLPAGGKIEVRHFEKEVNIEGCCGGQCNVLEKLKYYPFCGKGIKFD